MFFKVHFDKLKNELHQLNINVSYGILDVFPGRGLKTYRQIKIEISIFQHVRALCKRNNEIFLCM